MRFLHLADIHLDTPFRSRSNTVAEALRRASRKALEVGVDEALARQLDAVLIAGDFFDSERLSVQSERFLMAALGRLGEAGIQVVYATGNHDPTGSAGAGARFPWPDHVHVVDGPVPSRIEILRDGTAVGGVTGAGHNRAGHSIAGHSTPGVTADLSRAFPRPTGSLPEVGLLHTQVTGARDAEQHARYAPSDLSRLRSAGYTYWALGHVHLRQALSEDPPIHYPGNTQGRSPRETGAKGGLLVDLSSPRQPRVDFLELGPVRWERLELGGLRALDRLTLLAAAIEDAWARTRSEDTGGLGTDWMLRVELSGPSPLYRLLSSPGSLEELRDALVPALGLLDLEVRFSGVRPLHLVEHHIGREDVLGEVLRMVRELQRPDGPSPSEVLGISTGDLAGAGSVEGPGSDAYLRALLEQADDSLLDALMEDAGP